MAVTMVPAPEARPAVLPTERLGPTGLALPELRAKYRTISDARNVASIVGLWVAALAIIEVGVWSASPYPYVAAACFIAMGPIHARFAILMHEAAHKLLFTSKRLNDVVGNHTYVPTSGSSLGHGYEVGIGKLNVDLTQLPSGTPARVEAHVGIGDLRIVVPHDTPVTVSAHVKAGSIDALGRHEDGTGARLVTGGGSVLTVVANVGAGHIEVIRAP